MFVSVGYVARNKGFMEMSKDLDKKLHEVLSSVGELYYPEHEYNKSDSYDKSNKATRDDAIQQIKDCFIADGWIKPGTPQAQMMQDMVNLHARMKADMIRLGMTPTPQKRASGVKR